MNILFATLVLPHDQTTGGEVASQSFIDAMRLWGHQVDVFGYTRSPLIAPDGSHGVAVRPIETASAGWRRYLWLTQSVASQRAYVVQKFCSGRYLAALRDRVGARKADVLVIDHAKMGWLLPYASELAEAVVLIAHNHEAALYADEAQRTPGRLTQSVLWRESRLMAHLERRLANEVDHIWVLSSADANSFAALSDSHKVALMPLPGRSIAHTHVPRPPRCDIGLLGTWSWDVNGRGLNWFVDKVLPLLPGHVSICAAGRGSERVNGVASNIVGLGFVDDAMSFMRSARVLAVPTIGGSGIQLKTIEAIAAGVATVSTSIGVRGIEAVPDYVTVEDTPQAFANALIAQLANPPPIPEAGRDWARQRQARFTEAVQTQLAKLQQLSPGDQILQEQHA